MKSPVENRARLNPLFDVTPAELIAGIITGRGIAMTPCTRSITAVFAK